MACKHCCKSHEQYITTYDLGDVVRVEGHYKDALTGQVMDPDVVKLSVWNPAEVETQYEYGVDFQVAKDATGEYHSDIDADTVGIWSYRWWSTGDGKGAGHKTQFRVAL